MVLELRYPSISHQMVSACAEGAEAMAWVSPRWHSAPYIPKTYPIGSLSSSDEAQFDSKSKYNLILGSHVYFPHPWV